MKIFLTGSTGFVGQNLISYLKNNDISRLGRQQLHKIAEESMKDVGAIIHLAGKAHDLKKSANPAEYYEVNFELTKKLYDAFLESDAKKFVFISSVKAAMDTVEGILTEDVSPTPFTDYGKSKLMAEVYIQAQPLPEGKSFYILRPCMIHGPGNKGNLNLLYKFVEKGIPYPLAKFYNKRSFLSIQNLCFVINTLIEEDIPSGVYNVADDDALSTTEVVHILAQSLAKKPSLWPISAQLIRLLAKVGDIVNLPLNTERLTKLTENYVVSNSKIKKALGKPLPLSTVDGLKITANSFKKQS